MPSPPREFREIGHQLVDRMADYLADVENQALFPTVDPARLDDLFREALPADPTEPQAVLRELEEKLFPYLCHVNHPGYFGFITSTPTPMGILGDFLASALNQNLGLYSIGPGAVALERRTVRWLADLAGYGEKAGGNLTSGGTMANFEGLKLARDWATGNRAQFEGLREPVAMYVSEERHVSIDKAADAIGIGRDYLRIIPTDDALSVRVDALEAAIAQDHSEGVRPLCIIGLAGTTNTGAIDSLRALRRIASREGAWFHVDAAYGGGMLLSRKSPGLLDGLAEADSITIDPHKWFYAPLDAGAILVRDGTQPSRSWGMRPAYLVDEMDAQQARFDYYVHGFEQSRRFRGLKVWMSFKRYGSKQIGEWIDANVEQARHLYDLVLGNPDFEAAARPQMSAICIRYCGRGAEGARSERLHAEVARRIEENGRFWITTTRLKDRSWFRINPVNFRTRLEDMDGLLDELQRECEAASV